jgi:hypothetical protein
MPHAAGGERIGALWWRRRARGWITLRRYTRPRKEWPVHALVTIPTREPFSSGCATVSVASWNICSGVSVRINPLDGKVRRRARPGGPKLVSGPDFRFFVVGVPLPSPLPQHSTCGDFSLLKSGEFLSWFQNHRCKPEGRCAHDRRPASLPARRALDHDRPQTHRGREIRKHATRVRNGLAPICCAVVNR